MILPQAYSVDFEKGLFLQKQLQPVRKFAQLGKTLFTEFMKG